MTMVRTVLPELLDELSISDPRAKRSRRDLKRLHKLMGTRAILLAALRKMSLRNSGSSSSLPLEVLEIGAGDGSLMLGVARALKGQLQPISLTLLDQYNLLEQSTKIGYANAGWNVTTNVCDILNWAKHEHDLGLTSSKKHWDLIVCNLFLHHFEESELRLVLNAVSARTNYFFACEPHRTWLALTGSLMVSLMGANAVTRQDAVLSVRAGFSKSELSATWQEFANDWILEEYPAGLFSHCFCASKNAIHANECL